MDLKSLFYPLIMFAETALKNYVLEAIISQGRSPHFKDIYRTLITDYGRHRPGTSRYRKAYRRRLRLRNTIYGVLSEQYKLNEPIVQHFYHKDLSMPVWGIFELISLGQFGPLLFFIILEPYLRSIW